MMTFVIALLLGSPVDEVRVRNVQELRSAVASAKPGTKVLLAAGEYPGGLHFENLHGTAEKPIELGAESPSQMVRSVGGGGLQFSKVSHLILHDFRIEKASHNGMNIDDGGDPTRPSHHITLQRLRVSDLPPGNRDGIKLSGIRGFTVKDCVVQRWGGSAIDMVGCHDGVIESCEFRKGGDNAVQAKGGSSNITVRQCFFSNPGQRGVNIGGSTGLQFFRPALSGASKPYFEARNITVEGCIFFDGVTPVAFVGSDRCSVRYNTIYQPQRWALRILQETREHGFGPCRNGLFANNLIVFQSGQWSEGGVNVGPGTAPETFAFRNNVWYCSDRPELSQPRLPKAEEGGIVGKDPQLVIGPDDAPLRVRPGSPAQNAGAHAFKAGS